MSAKDHDEHGEVINEIGWMVLPEFQGRGLGRSATDAILDKARHDTHSNSSGRAARQAPV